MGKWGIMKVCEILSGMEMIALQYKVAGLE